MGWQQRRTLRNRLNEELYKTKVPSTAFMHSPRFAKELGRRCSLSFSYESDDTAFETCERIVFDGVEAFKCTYYTANSLEVFDAYDRILKIISSPWLKEIKNNLTQARADTTSLVHLRIFFDDGPCYEFICRSFEVIKEERRLVA
jgi:hypothetical protein